MTENKTPEIIDKLTISVKEERKHLRRLRPQEQFSMAEGYYYQEEIFPDDVASRLKHYIRYPNIGMAVSLKDFEITGEEADKFSNLKKNHPRPIFIHWLNASNFFQPVIDELEHLKSAGFDKKAASLETQQIGISLTPFHANIYRYLVASGIDIDSINPESELGKFFYLKEFEDKTGFINNFANETNIVLPALIGSAFDRHQERMPVFNQIVSEYGRTPLLHDLLDRFLDKEFETKGDNSLRKTFRPVTVVSPVELLQQLPITREIKAYTVDPSLVQVLEEPRKVEESKEVTELDLKFQELEELIEQEKFGEARILRNQLTEEIFKQRYDESAVINIVKTIIDHPANKKIFNEERIRWANLVAKERRQRKRFIQRKNYSNNKPNID